MIVFEISEKKNAPKRSDQNLLLLFTKLGFGWP